ncbi:MAG: hypothetical protein ACOYO1_11245 [Bacteroidales bacterium]
MKKVILIIIVICLSYNIYSQKENSLYQDTIDDIIDYYTIQLVSYTLKGDSLDDYDRNFRKSTINNISEIKSFLNKNENSIALFNDIQKIKDNSKEKFKQSDYQDLISFLTDDVFHVSEYKAIKKFKNNRDKKDFKSLSKNIKDSLEEYIEQIRKSEKTINPTVPTVIIKPEEPNGEQKTKPNYWLFGSLILMFVLIIYLYFLDYKKNIFIKDIKRSIKNIKNENNNLRSGNNVENLNNRIVYELKSEISQLKQDFEKIKTELNKYKFPVTINPIPEPQVSSIPNKIESKSKLIYYFSTPNDDGSFLDTHKTISFDSSSLSKYFKFEIEPDKIDIAKVYVIDDLNTQSHILMNHQIFLGSVCNYINSYSQSYTKIKTIEPGLAQLIDDKWYIKDGKKIHIKFE